MQTRDELMAQLSYEPTTGLFRWKVNKNRVVTGQIAGSSHLGYTRIKIRPHNYAAHRLAWLFTHGKWPKDEIDHINGDRSDNRLSNLREATHAQNAKNSNVRNWNKHGLRGVAKQTASKGWMACITSDGIKRNLGTYQTAEEAHAAYVEAAKTLHGSFVNLTTANHKETFMSRKSSVVLTPAEKKQALKDAKVILKEAQVAAKLLVAEAKSVAKARAAEDKEFGKRETAAAKAVEKAQAAVDALSAE